MRVLIVEDREHDREWMGEAVSQADLPIPVAASTKDEALQLIDAGTFDIAVVDVALHSDNDLDGLEVIKELHKRSPACKIIAVTLYPTEVGAMLLSHGATDFISKNWERVNWFSLLIERLRMWKRVQESPVPSA